MSIKKYSSGQWVDIPYRKYGTETDTLTILPAMLYPNDTTATVGLKGNMQQSGTPTPSAPIYPQETGDKTANLFDKSTATLGKAMYQNGENISSSFGHSDYISVNAKTQYYLSNVVPVTQFYTCCAYDSAKQFLSYCNLNATSGAITAPQNCKYIIINFIVSKIDDTMVNAGSIALLYEPFGYKIPISSAGQTTNVYLGETQSTRKIKKVLFNGTEDWRKSAINPNSYYLYTPIDNLMYTASLVCTHFQNKSDSYIYENNAYFTATKRLNVTDVDLHDADVSVFTAYLAAQYAAGTPVTLWYVLENPTTGIVNEPLMKIGSYADSISGISIPTIAGANTLDVQTTLKPSEVTASFNGWHPVTAAHERNNGQWD